MTNFSSQKLSSLGRTIDFLNHRINGFFLIAAPFVNHVSGRLAGNSAHGDLAQLFALYRQHLAGKCSATVSGVIENGRIKEIPIKFT